MARRQHLVDGYWIGDLCDRCWAAALESPAARLTVTRLPHLSADRQNQLAQLLDPQIERALAARGRTLDQHARAALLARGDAEVRELVNGPATTSPEHAIALFRRDRPTRPATARLVAGLAVAFAVTIAATWILSRRSDAQATSPTSTEPVIPSTNTFAGPAPSTSDGRALTTEAPAVGTTAPSDTADSATTTALISPTLTSTTGLEPTTTESIVATIPVTQPPATTTPPTTPPHRPSPTTVALPPTPATSPATSAPAPVETTESTSAVPSSEPVVTAPPTTAVTYITVNASCSCGDGIGVVSVRLDVTGGYSAEITSPEGARYSGTGAVTGQGAGGTWTAAITLPANQKGSWNWTWNPA